MTRARRASGASNIRIFRTESGSRLAGLADIGFGDESQLHKLIESNIGTLFHGLTFLSRECRELDGGRHIPDTVAFDKQRNTFVVIEYKNKMDMGVIHQAKTYLKYVKKNKPALVVEYIKSEGDGTLDPKSYSWDVYAIIMAPDFYPNQLDSTEDDKSLELYEIKRYDAGILTVKHVGGAHERTMAVAKRNDPIQDAGKHAAAPRLNGADGDAGLPDIAYATGMSRPAELEFPDGSSVGLKSWTGILAGVADWLVSKGHLDESHCPVPIGEKNAILNTRPFHQNGKRFSTSKEVGGLHVFLNADPANIMRYSIKLIGIAGLNPADFKASFADSTRPTKPTPPPALARVTIAEGSSVPGCEKTNGCYVPHTVTVGVGGKVVWTNEDLGAHTVTSGALTKRGPDGTFDSRMLVPGAEFSHVFEEAGEYPYFDLVHPWMQGVVIAKDVHDPR